MHVIVSPDPVFGQDGGFWVRVRHRSDCVSHTIHPRPGGKGKLERKGEQAFFHLSPKLARQGFRDKSPKTGTGGNPAHSPSRFCSAVMEANMNGRMAPGTAALAELSKPNSQDLVRAPSWSKGTS